MTPGGGGGGGGAPPPPTPNPRVQDHRGWSKLNPSMGNIGGRTLVERNRGE